MILQTHEGPGEETFKSTDEKATANAQKERSYRITFINLATGKPTRLSANSKLERCRLQKQQTLCPLLGISPHKHLYEQSEP